MGASGTAAGVAVQLELGWRKLEERRERGSYNYFFRKDWRGWMVKGW